jgi:hypothetical protein
MRGANRKGTLPKQRRLVLKRKLAIYSFCNSLLDKQTRAVRPQTKRWPQMQICKALASFAAIATAHDDKRSRQRPQRKPWFNLTG